MEKELVRIENAIYKINGLEVMLDRDLARLYHVETKRTNEVVKNNSEKFPRRVSFILNDNELENLLSKFLIANIRSKKLCKILDFFFDI